MFSLFKVKQLVEQFKEEEFEDPDVVSAAIRLGNDLSETFWEDFLKLCSNSKEVAALLDVPEYQVSEWVFRINKARESFEKDLDNIPKDAERAKMLDT